MVKEENILFKDQPINSNKKHTNKVCEVCNICFKDLLGNSDTNCFLSTYFSLRGGGYG